MTVFLCTDCPERCILTKSDHDCGKTGDRVWLHREEILYRFCPNVEESCYECTRVPNKDEYRYSYKDERSRLCRNWYLGTI